MSRASSDNRMTSAQYSVRGHIIFFVDNSTAHGLLRIKLAEGECLNPTLYMCACVDDRVFVASHLLVWNITDTCTCRYSIFKCILSEIVGDRKYTPRNVLYYFLGLAIHLF